MRSVLVVPGLVLVFTTGCPADSEPSDTEAMATTAASTGSAAPTTGGPDCGTGDCCAYNPNFCNTTDPSTGSLPPSSSSSDGDGTATTETTAATDTTDGAPSCEFGPLLASLADGKTEPVDCGTATLADDAAAWAAASTCAAAAAAAQEAFFVAFELPSIDSNIYDGYYGSVGFAYALGRLYSDPLTEPLVSYSCADVAATAGCEPDVGQHCLECVGMSEPMAVECAPW